jgi:hypothetical protein
LRSIDRLVRVIMPVFLPHSCRTAGHVLVVFSTRIIRRRLGALNCRSTALRPG